LTGYFSRLSRDKQNNPGNPVDPVQMIDVIQTEPTDNKYLACALEGEADYIVSGDRHLLDLGLYQGIKIIKAKAFLKIWDKQLKT
jgi:predicted nucleic acid-binding protein